MKVRFCHKIDIKKITCLVEEEYEVILNIRIPTWYFYSLIPSHRHISTLFPLWYRRQLAANCEFQHLSRLNRLYPYFYGKKQEKVVDPTFLCSHVLFQVLMTYTVWIPEPSCSHANSIFSRCCLTYESWQDRRKQ